MWKTIKSELLKKFSNIQEKADALQITKDFKNCRLKYIIKPESKDSYYIELSAYEMKEPPILMEGIHTQEVLSNEKYDEYLLSLENSSVKGIWKEDKDPKIIETIYKGMGYQCESTENSVTISSVHEYTGNNDFERLVRRMERYLYFVTMTFGDDETYKLDDIANKIGT